MKNIYSIVCAAILACASMHGYVHRITNNTPGTIKVQAFLIAGPTKEVTVNAGGEAFIDVVGWLTSEFVITGISDIVDRVTARVPVPDPKFSKDVTVDYKGPANFFYKKPPAREPGQDIKDYIRKNAPKVWVEKLLTMPTSFEVTIRPR